MRSNVKYELLSQVDNTLQPRRKTFNHMFPSRQIRYIFFRCGPNAARGGTIFEVMLYSSGYPAEVEMESDFIDLGAAKTLTSIGWEADLPPGTKVEVQTRTGNTLEVEKRYYTKQGVEVSETKWKKLPGVARGEVVEVVREGTDWSGWSQVYGERESVFLSPTPRKYVQVKVTMSTEDPEETPRLEGVWLSYHDPLVSGGVEGEITPREVGFGEETVFVYRIHGRYRSGDRGYDRVFLRVPSEVREVGVRVGGVEAESTYWSRGDSLVVALPEVVRGDSVEVWFTGEVVRNGTVFAGSVWHSGEEGVWQAIEPLGLHGMTVYVPSVEGGRLIREVEVDRVWTERRGEVGVEFSLAKVAGGAKVRVYDAGGRLVRELEGDGGRSGRSRYKYRWDGRDGSGELVLPGVYVVEIRVDSDLGQESVYKTTCVIY